MPQLSSSCPLSSLRYRGIVGSVKPTNDPSTQQIRVNFADGQSDTVPFPHDDVERLDGSEDCFPTSFNVGDHVECFYQNGVEDGKWFHGRVYEVSADGSRCDVMYIDGDVSERVIESLDAYNSVPLLKCGLTHTTFYMLQYESNIPVAKKKIRLVKRHEEPSSYEGLVGQKALFRYSGDEGCNATHRHGHVTSIEGSGIRKVCRISFADGSLQSLPCEEVATAVMLKDFDSDRQHVWPDANVSAVGRRRKSTKKIVIFDDVAEEKPAAKRKAKVKTEQPPKAPNSKNNKAPAKSSKRVAVKFEAMEDIGDYKECTTNTGDHRIIFKTSTETEVVDSEEAEDDHAAEESQDSTAVVVSRTNKKIAKELPAGLPNVLWCAINSAEAHTGANFLSDFLYVHDTVPPTYMVQKLLDLVKYGPKADGSQSYFKDPQRTELASKYVYGLISSSSRLVRSDLSVLFGCSSWEDIETLLAQSIVQTEGLLSGRRLALGLHLASRGAKCLALMFKTELSGINLLSTSTATFETMSLKAKPTVKVLKAYGVRAGLKCAVQNATKCLVRHSRFILDTDSSESVMTVHDESCAIEVSEVIDNLGAVISFMAFLFCIEERVDLFDPRCAILIKNEFENEFVRSLDELPEMTDRNKKALEKNLKMSFILSLNEDFAMPMTITLSKLFGLGEELAMVGCVI